MEDQEMDGDVKPKLENSPECQPQEIIVEEIPQVIPKQETTASALPTTVITTPRPRMITTAGHIR